MRKKADKHKEHSRELEEYAEDGRLTEPSDGKMYRWREMIEKAQKFSRPLTDEEAEEFRIK